MGLLSNRVERKELRIGDHIYCWRTAYTYAHHGIYVGEGEVIHFTRRRGSKEGTNTFLDSFVTSWGSSGCRSLGPCEKCGDNTGDNSGVLCSCLECFLCGDPLYRFEYGESISVFLLKARGGTCTMAPSDPPDLVVHRAKYLLQNGFGCYNLFKNNCEDFALYCKTGFVVRGSNTGRSGQAAFFWEGNARAGSRFGTVLASSLHFFGTNPVKIIATSAVMHYASRYASDLSVRTDVIKDNVEDLIMTLGQ